MESPNPKGAGYLREDVGSISCSCGQGGEERGLPCCLDSVDHAQPQVLEVGGLAVGVDKNKDIINSWKKDSRDIDTLLTEVIPAKNLIFPLDI